MYDRQSTQPASWIGDVGVFSSPRHADRRIARMVLFAEHF
jgi:hypothetical protein